MSAKFNTLLHGSLNDVYDALEYDNLDGPEIRAVLQNIVSHIQVIEKQQEKHDDSIGNMKLQHTMERNGY